MYEIGKILLQNLLEYRMNQFIIENEACKQWAVPWTRISFSVIILLLIGHCFVLFMHDLILFFLQQIYLDANIEENSLSKNVVLIEEHEPIAGNCF